MLEKPRQDLPFRRWKEGTEEVAKEAVLEVERSEEGEEATEGREGEEGEREEEKEEE